MLERWKEFGNNVRDNVLGIIVAACLGFWLIFPKEYISMALYPSIIPLIIFLFIYWKVKVNFKELFLLSGIREYIPASIFSILYLCMMPVRDLYRARITDIYILKMIILIGYTVILTGCIFVDLLVIFKRDGKEEVDKKGNGFDGYKNCFFAIGLVSILYIVSCFPGLLHGDGWNIWRMATTGWGWSDWHPIGYTYFCRICSKVWNNPFSVIMVQTAIWIYVNWYILFFLDKYIGKFACRIYTVATFVSINSYYLMVLYKDVIFGICFLGFTISLIAYAYGERNKRCYIQLVLFGTLAAQFRHMMIVPIMAGALAALIYQLVKNRKEALYAGIIVFCIGVGYVGIRGGLLKLTDAKENPGYIKYSVAMQMMGAYAASGNVDDKSKEFMEQYVSLEKWAEVYNKDPYFSDNISRAAYGIMTEDQLVDIGKHGAEIIKVNWRFLLRSPLIYVRELFRHCSILWRLSPPDDYGVWAGTTFYNAEPVVAENNPELNPVRNYMSEIMEPIAGPALVNPVWKAFAYYSGFALFVIGIGIYIAVWRKEWAYLVGAVPGIVLAAMLMISIPYQDPRYVNPLIQVGMLYIAIFSSNYKRCFSCGDSLKTVRRKRNYYWIFIAFVVYFAGGRIRAGYIGTVLETMSITFEDADLIQNYADFPGELYYADGGAWFSPEYTMTMPYRISSDVILQFVGYCCSDYPVIEVYVNGEYVGIMEKEDPELNMTTYSCPIAKEYFDGRSQTIEFKATPSIELIGVDAIGVYREFEASFYMTEMKWIVQE